MPVKRAAPMRYAEPYPKPGLVDPRDRTRRIKRWTMKILKKDWRSVEIGFHAVMSVKRDFTRCIWTDDSKRHVVVDFSTRTPKRITDGKIQGLKLLLKAEYLEGWKPGDFINEKFNIDWPQGFTADMAKPKLNTDDKERDWHCIRLTEDEADFFERIGYRVEKWTPGWPSLDEPKEETEDEATGHPEFLHGPPKRLDEDEYYSGSDSPERLKR